MNNRGFSFVEVVMVVAVVGLLSAAAAVGFDPVLDAWVQGDSRGQTSNTLSIALNRMVQEISQMRNATSLTIASANDFQFTDVNNNVIRYRLSSNQLLRNTDVLARDVQTLNFTYWNINNAAIANPTLAPAETDLWRMAVQVSGSKAGQTVTLESHVRPRNLRRP